MYSRYPRMYPSHPKLHPSLPEIHPNHPKTHPSNPRIYCSHPNIHPRHPRHPRIYPNLIWSSLIVAMLDRTLDKVERDRLCLFLNKLILHKENAAALIQANGIKILIDLLPLAHLHTSRYFNLFWQLCPILTPFSFFRAIMANQSMAIEASSESAKDSQEKEW